MSEVIQIICTTITWCSTRKCRFIQKMSGRHSYLSDWLLWNSLCIVDVAFLLSKCIISFHSGYLIRNHKSIKCPVRTSRSMKLFLLSVHSNIEVPLSCWSIVLCCAVEKYSKLNSNLNGWWENVSRGSGYGHSGSIFVLVSGSNAQKRWSESLDWFQILHLLIFLVSRKLANVQL